jgi:hypothetical protein
MIVLHGHERSPPLARLAKRDDHRLGIGTSPALKGPLIVVNLLGWLDQHEKHGHTALRARSLDERRRRRFQAMGSWHHAVLCYAAGPT